MTRWPPRRRKRAPDPPESKTAVQPPFLSILEAFPPGSWLKLEPRFGIAHLGWLPEILLAGDPRSIRAQLEDRYAHGGGWRPIGGFAMHPTTLVMSFPEDEPYRPAGAAKFGDELAVFYPNCSLLAIIQPDGSFEVCRVD